MIEAIIGIAATLAGIIGYVLGRRKNTSSDLSAMRKAKENHEKITRNDDLPSEFDRLREKRR